MATIHSFEELEIWKKAQAYGVLIYNLWDSNHRIKRDFSFKDQIKRAALSISNNIAEGFEYNNNNDFYRFLRIAKGSCGEVKNCLIFSENVGYCSSLENQILISSFSILGKQIGKLMAAIYVRKIKKSVTTKPVTRNP